MTPPDAPSTPPPAHVLGRIAVKDAAAWDRYRAAVPATLEPFGGTVLARAGAGRLLGSAPAGEPPVRPTVVLLRFPDAARAQAWFDSPAYQALLPLRAQAADVVLTLYPD